MWYLHPERKDAYADLVAINELKSRVKLKPKKTKSGNAKQERTFKNMTDQPAPINRGTSTSPEGQGTSTRSVMVQKRSFMDLQPENNRVTLKTRDGKTAQ